MSYLKFDKTVFNQYADGLADCQAVRKDLYHVWNQRTGHGYV